MRTAAQHLSSPGRSTPGGQLPTPQVLGTARSEGVQMLVPDTPLTVWPCLRQPLTPMDLSTLTLALVTRRSWVLYSQEWRQVLPTARNSCDPWAPEAGSGLADGSFNREPLGTRVQPPLSWEPQRPSRILRPSDKGSSPCRLDLVKGSSPR